MIEKAVIDRIFDASNIIEVVSDFVSLKKRGANYLGLCPFHNEKTPSFTVSPAKGIYKCFGCGKGGNAVNFIMDLENLSYVETLKWLAKKYNIEVVEKEKTAEDVRMENESESMLIVNQWANKYFMNNLHQHKDGVQIGLSYFHERGFHDAIIQKFEIGYSLDEKDALTKAARHKGYQLEFLNKTGLTITKEESDYSFDRFRGRVMFPIHALSGKVLGFGGRILKHDEKAAKYMNSPESTIYHKSKVLYGLFLAKRAINQQDECFLVEGYTDVMAFHQAGIENVVASSGTALSEDQIRLLNRFSNNLTMIFDGDAAGIKASLRGIDMVLEQGMNVQVIRLPDGEDPDSFSKKCSPTELLAYIKLHKTDFISFKTNLLLADANRDPVQRARLISDITRSIAIIPDAITRSVYVKECSKIMDVDEQVLYTEINKQRRKKFANKQNGQALQETFTQAHTKKQAPPEIHPLPEKQNEVLEREIVRLLLNYGEKVLFAERQENEFGEEHAIETRVFQYIFQQMEENDLKIMNAIYKKICAEYHENMNAEVYLDTRYFINHPDPQISAQTINILSQAHELSAIWKKYNAEIDKEEDRLAKYIPEILERFKIKRLEDAIRQLGKKIREAEASKEYDTIHQLQLKHMELIRLHHAISKEIA